MFKTTKYYLPTVGQSWLLILSLIFGGGLLALLFNKLILYNSVESTLLSYPLLFLPPALIIYLTSQKAERELLSPTHPLSIKLNSPNFGKLGLFGSLLLIFPLLFAFNFITEPLSSWMKTPPFMEQLNREILDHKVISFISIVILAPLLEEWLCRGVILRGLLAHTTPTKAIILSSFLFGVMHLNPWQAIPAFLLALLMGWIYWRSHSLWLPIFIHAVNNAFAYLVTLLNPSLPSDVGFKELVPPQFYYWLFLLATIYTIFAINKIRINYNETISTKIRAIN